MSKISAQRKKELAQLYKQKAARKARNDFLAFTRYTFGPDYKVNWHHRYIANLLDRFVSGDLKRLIINCPARMGKSELCSRRLPAYIFGRNPDAKVIACSYGQDLANDMSVDVKQIIRSSEYSDVFPETNLPNNKTVRQRDQHYRNKKEIWEILNHDGRYVARGVGGGITGKGGDFLLLDDPIKDHKQAHSPTERDKVWDWFQSTFLTRAQKDARVLVIQTRWHQDDPVGRIKRQMREVETAKEWKIVNFPALYRENVRDLHPEDPREPGEALWPWFKDRDEWLTLEETDPETFRALAQGMPSPPGGDIIKEEWIEANLWQELPSGNRQWVWSIDPKGGSKESQSSEAVIQLWCHSKQEPANAYLVDQQKGVWSQGETEDVIRELYQKEPWSLANTILIEGKGDGLGIKDHLSDEIPGITTVDPWADKEQRLRDVQPFWRSGNVKVPDYKSTPTRQSDFYWARTFVNQHISFPGGSDRDDMVDASTYAIDFLLGSRGDTEPGEMEHYLSKYYG